MGSPSPVWHSIARSSRTWRSTTSPHSAYWWPRPKPSSASPPKQARVVLLFAKGSGACRSPFLFLERHKGSVSRAMSDELEQLVQSAQADIAACADARTLETLRVDLLGKKGRVTDLLKQLGGMAPEARKAFGEQVNRAKEALSSARSEEHTSE